MKTQFILFSALLVAFLFSAEGCSQKQATPLKLTEADNDKMVTVNTGENMVVKLAGNPSTGYTWETKELDSQMLEQVGETAFESDNASPNLVGVGGTLVLNFKALKPGNTKLTLVYHRP